MRTIFFLVFTILFSWIGLTQEISLFKQFNGRYDYTAIGNTMNSVENGPSAPCQILTSSSADLTLNNNDTIIAAYLYWAGSGEGDFEVSLNNQIINAECTFTDAIDDERIFFAAFAEVTELVINQGSSNYTLSNLDLTEVISAYCSTGTNFAGWAIAVVYENNNLPLNQVNVYDGLESVPEELSITLNNLNVLDNENAKIGFVAWEGDSALAVTEQLSINGNVLSNPPLNPESNAFNGTNSFTNSNNLYNMDLDVYNIQNNINIGDTSATISLTSGQDFVMINSIITVLNSQLPDATISIDTIDAFCGDRTILVDYTIYNTNSTDDLAANIPITFYADNLVIEQVYTNSVIPIGSSINNSIELNIPGTNLTPELRVMVDDIGNGTGIITETNETNNTDNLVIELIELPEIIRLDALTNCNEGFETSTFNLFEAFGNDTEIDANNLSFYTTLENAELAINVISHPENYQNLSNPESIYVREEGEPCFQRYMFQLNIENCPPSIPEGFSPNNDGKNDNFNIKGLYNIFTDHKLLIYNRNGTLLFKGNNNLKWNGLINKGTGGIGNLVPVGTYYYVLQLNDSNFESISGWVYVNY